MVKNLYKIGNAVDDIYTKIAGVPYPVSAAVGSGPEPTPTTVTSTVTYTETEATVWKMELAVTEGMSFAELTEQYPDWTGSVTSGEKVVTFTADDITVDYVTVTDLTVDSVPADGDECTMVIMNGDVELYNSTTAAHVVEIPVPAEPLEVSNVVFHYDVEEEYKTNWSVTADIAIDNAPEGWIGWLTLQDGEEETGFEFTTENISNGVLTISDLFFVYATDGPDGDTVNFTIIKDQNEPQDDPDNIFGSVDVEFTTEQNIHELYSQTF